MVYESYLSSAQACFICFSPFPAFGINQSEAEILFGKSNKNGLLFCCQFFALSKCEIGFDTTYQLASLDLSERDERMIWHLRILDTTANCKNPSQLLLHTHLFYNYPSNPIIRGIEQSEMFCTHTHGLALFNPSPLITCSREFAIFFLLLLKNFSKWGIFHLVVHPTFSKQTVNETFTAFSKIANGVVQIRIFKICVLSLPKIDFFLDQEDHFSRRNA